MVETCEDGIWRWTDMMADLRSVGLEGIKIDPFSLCNEGHTIGGETKDGIGFMATWMKGHFLLVTMTEKRNDIIDAFSKILEYKPFAEYISGESGLYTVEWDKMDPERRFKELQEKEEKGLRRI